MEGSAGREALRYHPPKSALFGHAARTRDPKRAWEEAHRFLEAWTRFQAMRGVQLRVETAAAREGAVALFGPESHGGWFLHAARLAEAAAFVLAAPRARRWTESPARLHIGYELTWRAFDGEGVRGAHRSVLGLQLDTTRLLLQPFLFFPRPYDDPELRAFFDAIERDLPWTFRDDCFQRLLPSPRGGYGRTRKLPKGWRRPEPASGRDR